MGLVSFVGLTVVVDVVSVVVASVVVLLVVAAASVVLLVVDAASVVMLVIVVEASVVILIVVVSASVVVSSSKTLIKSGVSLTTASKVSGLLSNEFDESSKLVRWTPESSKLSALFLTLSDSNACALISVIVCAVNGSCDTNGSSVW